MKPLLIFVCITLLFYACKKQECCNDASNPNCENYDPCFGKSTIDTAFLVLLPYGGFPPPSDECVLPSYDTIYGGGTGMRLEAPKHNPSNSTYQWTVGNDPTVYKTKAFEIDFDGWLNAGNWEKSMEVRCTIKTPPNGCIKLKDTMVVTKRKVFFTKYNPSIGVFYGKFNGSNIEDTFKNIFIVGLDKFRGYPVDYYQRFFIGAPFQDSFTDFDANNYNKTCKMRYYSLLQPSLPKSAYVSSYEIKIIYFGRTSFTFWVQKPGEQERVYEFVGNKIY